MNGQPPTRPGKTVRTHTSFSLSHAKEFVDWYWIQN